MMVAEKLPLGVATVALIKPVPGGPEIGGRVGLAVGLGEGTGVGAGEGVGVGVGVGVEVGVGTGVGEENTGSWSVEEEFFLLL